MPDDRPYLAPYQRAIEQHGDGFESLLWASRKTQTARFDAIERLCRPDGLRLLDAGCGQADLLEHLIAGGIFPSAYIGIEAMTEHAEAARRKALPRCTIIQADFVNEPHRLLTGSDILIFCGSLNTMDAGTSRRILRIAFEAAAQAVVFNFLSSPSLAAASWLTWHERVDVLAFARTLTPDVSAADDYLDGDCTICMRKSASQRGRLGRTCL